MCYKLQNRFYLLTLQTILGAVLVILALPLLGVSSYLFIDNVGISLSPIWLAILIEVTGLVAVLTWPSKLILIVSNLIIHICILLLAPYITSITDLPQYVDFYGY
ncbi:hypothetical protein LOD99_13421 [Oopsacas minuta]|uniref:Uncharacterized protein n=1 Tax=Oopsacas minuta TaxID=111878 RepID=A0AAV7KJU0_9METZ|nr:hypothetical protein LOD99_13421 [Oopsacas minuta]